MLLNDAALSYSHLQLNINMPYLEEAWLDGYEQGSTEYAECNNPFPTGSLEYRHWNDGWWAGFFNEPPLFGLDGQVKQTPANTHHSLSAIMPLNRHPISAKQWWLVLAEIFSGILACFAAFQLINLN